MTHGTRLDLWNERVKHIVVNLLYSKGHFVLLAIRVLAHGAGFVSSRQIYHPLKLVFTLHNWSNLRCISQPQLLLKLPWAVELKVRRILSGRSLIIGEERLFQGFDGVATLLRRNLKHKFYGFVRLVADAMEVLHEILLWVFCESDISSFGKLVAFSPLVLSRCP